MHDVWLDGTNKPTARLKITRSSRACAGSFTGAPADYLGMEVDVQVTRNVNSAPPAAAAA